MKKENEFVLTCIAILLLFIISIQIGFCQNKKEESNLYKAKLACDKGNYKATIGYIKRVIAVDQQNADAYFLKGLANLNLNIYYESISDFTAAISLNPSYSQAYANRGIAKNKVGEFAEALQDFDKSLQLDSKCTIAITGREFANARLHGSEGNNHSVTAQQTNLTNNGLEMQNRSTSKKGRNNPPAKSYQTYPSTQYTSTTTNNQSGSTVGKYSSDISSEIKRYVEEQINKWQEKSEFERTADYKVRISDENRKRKIEEFTNQILVQIKEREAKYITPNSFSIGTYDADNESFLVEREGFRYPIRVPLSEARDFKTDWNNMDLSKTDFYIDNSNHLQLSAFTITDQTTKKVYRYDDKKVPKYQTNNITYNFNPIDSKDLNIPKTETGEAKIEVKNSVFGASEIDVNIPMAKKSNPHAYAVIIGNENYSSFQPGLSTESNVDFAVNDANTFKEYCVRCFGIPQGNIKFCKNATAGILSQAIDWINKLINKEGGNAEVFFYYAGHGMPDELTKEAYIVPVDVSGSNMQSAVKLSYVYNKLTEFTAKKVTVFLDACFSGGARNSSLASNTRGVKVHPKEGFLKGNIVVFTSSSGEQSSLPYKDVHHGIFTYYLLKKIQEEKGSILYEDLFEYVKKEVDLNCVKINDKEQTPDLLTSEEVGSKWKLWRF